MGLLSLCAAPVQVSNWSEPSSARGKHAFGTQFRPEIKGLVLLIAKHVTAQCPWQWEALVVCPISLLSVTFLETEEQQKNGESCEKRKEFSACYHECSQTAGCSVPW